MRYYAASGVKNLRRKIAFGSTGESLRDRRTPPKPFNLLPAARLAKNQDSNGVEVQSEQHLHITGNLCCPFVPPAF
jgi:hypothetical protein